MDSLINCRNQQRIFLSLVILLVLTSCTSKFAGDSDSLLNHLPQPKDKIIHFDNTTRISDFKIKHSAFKLKEIGNNLSGITWDPYNNQYFAIQNNSAIIYRYDRDFNFLGKMKKKGRINNDTEGVSFYEGLHLFVVTEANTAHKIKIDQNAFDKQYYYPLQGYVLANRPKIKNKGFEGIAYRPKSEKRQALVYVAQEGTGRDNKAKMKIYSFNPQVTSKFMKDMLYFGDKELSVNEPFNAEKQFKGIISDISGMTFDPTGETLIIVSQESSKAIQVDPNTGRVLSQLPLSGAPSYEGVTIGPSGELVFVSEKNWIQIYTTN